MFEVTWCKEPLEIKYRLVDVDTLICVACQEFLSLIISTDKWQEKLFDKAQESVNRKPSSNKNDKDKNDEDEKNKDKNKNDEDKNNNDKYDKYNKYINVYDTMKDLDDISHFSVIYLDLTMIYEIVRDSGNLKLTREIKPNTKSRLLDLLIDRNETCHSHKHETPDILYNRGITYLDHLKKFVVEVGKKEINSIPDESVREDYSKKYKELIRSLQKTLNDENNKYTSHSSIDETQIKKPVNRTQRTLSTSTVTIKAKPQISDCDSKFKKSDLSIEKVAGAKKMRLGRVHKNTDSSSSSKRSGLTVGGVSGSKKMRLGRVTKKTDSSAASEEKQD